MNACFLQLKAVKVTLSATLQLGKRTLLVEMQRRVSRDKRTSQNIYNIYKGDLGLIILGSVRIMGLHQRVGI